jgi:hypothetical protein
MMHPGLVAAYRRTDARLDELEKLPVGPTLAGRLVGLRGAMIDPYGAVRLHTLWGKVIAWAGAQQMIATHDTLNGIRMVDVNLFDEAYRLAAQEIACATSIPYPTALGQVELVARVADCMPQSWMALDRGELSLQHIKSLARATDHCTPKLTETVETKLIPIAVTRGWTPSELARAARREIIKLDPDGAAKRATAAKADADVEYFPGANETATMSAHGDAVLIRAMMDALDERADQMARDGDQRSPGLRRFHALADAVLGSAKRSTQTGPTDAAPRAVTLVTVDLTTLLGLNERPGELAGYGPITAQTARQIAADSTLRRLLTDPLTGNALDLARRSYKPSKLLRQLVEAAKPRCSMIGCSRPAHRCELDHRLEYLQGGHTNPDNLQPLCKLHHQMKTKKQWKVGANQDHSLTWTSFLGFTYTTQNTDPLTGDPDPPATAAA